MQKIVCNFPRLQTNLNFDTVKNYNVKIHILLVEIIKVLKIKESISLNIYLILIKIVNKKPFSLQIYKPNNKNASYFQNMADLSFFFAKLQIQTLILHLRNQILQI